MIKKCKSFCLKFKAALCGIHLVDKCLILFLAILLIQSAYGLFFHIDATTDSNNIDVIVRTSAAAIFGYFLSANFIRHSAPSHDQTLEEEPLHQSDNPEASNDKSDTTNRIGFVTSTHDIAKDKTSKGRITLKETESEGEYITANRLQIIVATIIGLFCLISLMILRNHASGDTGVSMTSSAAATITQFRDFVSGCIGFLIGTPSSDKNK